MLQETTNILIVDDDESIRKMLAIVLKKEGFAVNEAENGMLALKVLTKLPVDLIVSDIKMPDISGIELLKKVKEIKPQIPIIMITAYASTADAVEAMKLGAEDYVIKPFNIEELLIVIRKSLKSHKIEKENIELRGLLSDREKFENIIGRDPRMLKIFDIIDTIGQTDSTVLITGESGTGKELIARAIHNKSTRRAMQFVSINCGALPENLLESELFGHIKGAFTDAYRDKQGLFEIADKGTLFLDEIAEMSLKMQVKLLRTLQEMTIRNVGGHEEIKVDVRIIAATNKDLLRSRNNQEFREDLFYRLNVISIHVPPLRERKSDIPLLMEYFLKLYVQKFNKEIVGFEADTIDCFLAYPWPGNVRELENVIERGVALGKESTISKASLPAELVYNFPEAHGDDGDWKKMLHETDFNFNEYIDNLNKKIIIEALEMNGGNMKKATATLKMSYRSLRYLVEKYNLKYK